jgi:hypothetical protein
MKKIINIAKMSGKIQIVSLLIIGLIMLSVGGFLGFPFSANAGSLSSTKDTLSSSTPSATVQHSWVFTTATALTTDNTAAVDANFFFQFPQTNPDPFTINAIATTDISVTCATCGGSLFNVITVTPSDTGGEAKNDAIRIDVDETGQDNTAIPIGSVITVTIDNTPGITSPAKTAAVGTADTYAIEVETREDTGATTIDSGTAMVAVIEGVTVSVTIDETLSVILAATTATLCPATMPGTDQSDDSGHDADDITFGTLSAGNAFNHSCHLLTVGTNATDGYTTTVEKSQLLTSAGPDTIADGTCTSASCSNILSGEWAGTTDNGFGYCLQDVTGNPALTTDADDDSGTNAVDWLAAAQCNDASPEFKTFPTTATTEAVMKSYSEESGDQIRMGVVLNYSTSQAAGTYTTVLTFITTPIF